MIRTHALEPLTCIVKPGGSFQAGRISPLGNALVREVAVPARRGCIRAMISEHHGLVYRFTILGESSRQQEVALDPPANGSTSSDLHGAVSPLNFVQIRAGAR